MTKRSVRLSSGRLRELRVIAEDATPGPWRVVNDRQRVTIESRSDRFRGYEIGRMFPERDVDSDPQSRADARLCAAARAALPELLDEIDALHAELRDLRAKLPVGDGLKRLARLIYPVEASER